MARPSSAARLGLAALCLAVVLGCPGAAGYTKPDQLQKITAFRDAMLARPGQTRWSAALKSWTCPTPGGDCDPCGTGSWGNWEHLACRGERVTYTKERVPGDGTINHIHITDYGLEGAVPLAELCPLSDLVEFDLDGGALTGPIPTGYARCFPQLRELDLSYNQLTGTLPREIASVKTLEQFKVENNNLTGSIPEEYATLKAMNWLRFADNDFGGRVPASLAATAPHLYQLTLDSNNFEGHLYMLAEHSMVNFNAADNPALCGMVPVGLRFAHSFNPYGTRLGLPCPEEVASGWQDLSEQL